MWWWRARLIKGTKWASVLTVRPSKVKHTVGCICTFRDNESKNPTQRAFKRLMGTFGGGLALGGGLAFGGGLSLGGGGLCGGGGLA